MLGSILESMAMMGYEEGKSAKNSPTPAATSAAYARALEGATAITKANIAEFYPQRKEIPHSSIRIQRGSNLNQLEVIEATVPRHRHRDDQDYVDSRDQPLQSNREKLTIKMDRDGIPQCHLPKSYKLTTGPTVHSIPVNMVESPKKWIEQEKQDKDTFSRDVEAKNLLQSIIRLDTEVTEAAAAVYHYFETKKVDLELSPSGRAIQVIHSIKDELRKGNSKPAYQFLETAKSVLPILSEEREEAGLELEANIFSKDSEGSAIFLANSAGISNDALSQHDDMRSISEQTAAIFQFLDDAKSSGTGERGQRPDDPFGKKISHAIDSNENIFRILEEKEEVPSSTPDGIYLAQQRKELSGIFGNHADLKYRPNSNAHDVDNMDLEFVENFDLAYSEFVFYHPKLVAKNPELMKNLRIYKLQKLLEYNEILERTSAGKLNATIEEKRVAEESMQLKLKDAVRKKAARQTFLQSEVNDINWNTKQIQARLRWKVLKYSHDRAKRQLKLREQFKQIPQAKSRQDFVKLIPEGPHSKKLETAIKASFIAEGSSQLDVLSPKQDDQLRKFQVENSVSNSEILMLKQKLANLRKETQSFEWIPKTLTELDPATMHNFKKKIEKKEGVKL